MMSRFEAVEEEIEIAAPPAIVFERWTRFEEFPQFMEGVFEVRRLGGGKLRWRGKFAGKIREWDSQVTVWIPGRRLAWRATFAGARSSRAICVEDAGVGRTRLTSKMLIDLDDVGVQTPNLGKISQRLRENLARFKFLLESNR
jgi:uncharacterized membrane protein